MWNKLNSLIRELTLGDSLTDCCFADSKGTIVFGFKNHLNAVSVESYLPTSMLQKLLLADYRVWLIDLQTQIYKYKYKYENLCSYRCFCCLSLAIRIITFELVNFIHHVRRFKGFIDLALWSFRIRCSETAEIGFQFVKFLDWFCQDCKSQQWKLIY